MRTSTLRAAAVHASAEELTTGEAAKLLNCSRQHVVDLCAEGLLPFTTIGTHRRVRRSDVEAIRSRTEKLSRDQRRSLWLAYAVAGRFVADPEGATAAAREQIQHLRRQARGQAREWLDEWEKLLDGPRWELLESLTGRSLRSRELRQNTPFAGVIPADERDRVLAAWKRQDQGTRQ